MFKLLLSCPSILKKQDSNILEKNRNGIWCYALFSGNNNNNNLFYSCRIYTCFVIIIVMPPLLDNRRLTDKALSLSEYSSVTNHSLDSK